MDANKKKATEEKIVKIIKRLESNNFNATYVNTKEEALTLIKTMINKTDKTASGGSVTLMETKVINFLKEETLYIEDRSKHYEADFFVTSVNALTIGGELYLVDGLGNRISAILFGPKKVIVIVGKNKIVPNLRSAVERVKCNAAPPNTVRLSRDTPCSKNGICASPYFDEEDIFTKGCTSKDRICSNALIMAKQNESNKGRISVIIVGDDLGY